MIIMIRPRSASTERMRGFTGDELTGSNIGELDGARRILSQFTENHKPQLAAVSPFQGCLSINGWDRIRQATMNPVTHFLTGWTLANCAPSLSRKERAMVA